MDLNNNNRLPEIPKLSMLRKEELEKLPDHRLKSYLKKVQKAFFTYNGRESWYWENEFDDVSKRLESQWELVKEVLKTRGHI